MGRNKGDAARNKSRASSSSLAASLLQTPATSVGFGGFVGSARVDLPPAADGEHLVDVDGDAFLHLKRLSKKDPTTKLKALAALTALFDERPAAEVSALLPPWVYEYKRLVQDNNRQVRQSVHVAMTSLATCVGRGLAPYLRSLMGPWWVAQFDPSREVSEAAKTSFQVHDLALTSEVAFSGQKKRLEALMFCENEIFIQLDENLKLTPQTISEKATPIEESTEKHERVVSCSLLALAALLDVLIGSGPSSSGPENVANAIDAEATAKTKAPIRQEATKLCWNHKFLQQFVKSKSSRVRAATYQALRSFIQHLPEAFREEDMDVVVPSILGTFSEKDPACHQPMWDMVLLFAKGFPQVWGAAVVKKAVYPRLWGFLRHGFYGSQQISYPYLIVLISLIPPKAIIPAQNFLLEFFSSLWQGHTAPQMGPEDHAALLKAVQECLIWTVLNAKRFSDAEEYEAIQLQIALIDGVLVKLLWYGYIGGSPSQKSSLTTSVVDTSLSTDFSNSTSTIKASGVNSTGTFSKRFTQELRSCIGQTIRTLSGQGDEIMGPFWDEFQGSCFQIVQEAGKHWELGQEEALRMSRVADFFLVLGKTTSRGENREQWSLTNAVRPFVAKSFPAMMSQGHPESIRLIAKLTSIYGPSVFSLLSVSGSHNKQPDQGPQAQELENDEDMLQYFRKIIVPWCLDGSDDLSGPKAELVLAFVENNRFQGEWEFVIAHITGWQEDRLSSVDVKQVGVLATLLEKVTERRDFPSRNDDKMGKGNGVGSDWWRSPRIDGAAVKVASCNNLSHPACLRLLRSALGGLSSERNLSAIVSENAAVQILDLFLLRILGVLSASPKKWIRSAPSLIMDAGVSDSASRPEFEKANKENLQSAVATVNIIGDCTFSLLSLDRNHTISGKLLAALFCLKWACSESDVSSKNVSYDSAEEYDTDDMDSEEEVGFDDISQLEVFNDLKMSRNIDVTSGTLEDNPSSNSQQDWGIFGESLLLLWHKISPLLFGRFSALTRFRIRQVLIKCLRLAVLDEDFETAQQTAGRCAVWAQEVVGYACENADDVSEFLDLLLASEHSWPRWVVAPSSEDNQTGRILPSWKVLTLSEIEVQRHARFAAFVDSLCRTLSPQEVFLGSSVQSGTEVDREGNFVDGVAEGEPKISCESCRTWLVVELLCTWEWPGGSALRRVLPFLWSFARAREGSSEYTLLWGTIKGLFLGSSNSCASQRKLFVPTAAALEDDKTSTEEPFLRALLVLLKGLLEKEDGWSKVDARVLFRQFVIRPDAADLVSPICDVQILPHVLLVLMPILRKRSLESADASSDEEWQSFLQTTVSVWLQKAMTGPPLIALKTGSAVSGSQWIQVAVACFPLHSAGGAAAMASASSAPVTSQERELLLSLLRKQFSREATAAIAAVAAVDRMSQDKVPAKMERNDMLEVTLAQLVAAAIGYCWLDFGTDEWEFVLKRLRGWLQEAVVEAEEFTEAIVDSVKESQGTADSRNVDSIQEALENVVAHKRNCSVELSSVGVAIFSLLGGLSNLEGVDSTDAMRTMRLADWENVEMRVLEDILRILLAIGLAESGAASSSAGEKGANVIASQRKLQSKLWDNVADVAIGASKKARQAAIRAVDLWGVGNGAISALYALLFSPQPTISLQWVAYQFLSTHDILDVAVTYGIVVVSGETESKVEDESVDGDEVKVEDVKGDESEGIPPALAAQIRPELASIIETTQPVLIRSPLTSSLRVSYLLGWSLLLTRLQSLTALSPTREKLVQYVQDSDISPTLLDCLFQHIPLEQKLGTSGSRRKSLVAGVKMSSAAAPATRAAATGSVAFAVEGLWPIQKEGLVTLAGAIYGLMLLVLPACVRIWFTGLRDKSLASAIEAFTTTHCSPQLLIDEFAQVQASAVDEENLSIRPNRSLREVTAIYKKEEAGMDIVIRIPLCYPLRAVDVECTRRMGINETLLRKWILSMASFLRNQNGAITEAVQMWKKNVDREFEGVEECPICYSIIHTSNHNLPRLACKTCRHKFHSACLYKWFSTSHQSTCPLCKTPF